MNNDNLLKGKATQFQSGEEAARYGRKGGEQLGINNQKRKLFKEYIESEFDKEIVFDGLTVSKKEAAVLRLISIMLDKNTNPRDFLKALEFARNSIGEMPVEKYELSTIDQSVIDEVERMVFNDE
jgi:hypothetical protein